MGDILKNKKIIENLSKLNVKKILKKKKSNLNSQNIQNSQRKYYKVFSLKPIPKLSELKFDRSYYRPILIAIVILIPVLMIGFSFILKSMATSTPMGLLTISETKNSITPAYNIYVYVNGMAVYVPDTYDPASILGLNNKYGQIDISKLKFILSQINDLKTIPELSCPKSVTYGTTTTIYYKGMKSPDIQCLDTSNKNYLDLYKEIANLKSVVINGRTTDEETRYLTEKYINDTRGLTDNFVIFKESVPFNKAMDVLNENNVKMKEPCMYSPITTYKVQADYTVYDNFKNINSILLNSGLVCSAVFLDSMGYSNVIIYAQPGVTLTQIQKLVSSMKEMPFKIVSPTNGPYMFRLNYDTYEDAKNVAKLNYDIDVYYTTSTYQ